jgi:hypothetical protein
MVGEPATNWGDLVADGNQVRQRTGQAPAGRSWSIAGLVLAGLGLAMFPVGGLVGIVCGSIGRNKGDRQLGLVAMVASVISFFVSWVVAAQVLGR